MKKYVYPVDLLEQLCKRKLLKRENFEDLNWMDRSLALDKVLTSCYRNIFTKKQFDILKAAVQDVNSGANIEWDASIDDTYTVPYEDINIPGKF